MDGALMFSAVPKELPKETRYQIIRDVFTSETIGAMKELLRALLACESKTGGDKPGPTNIPVSRGGIDSLFDSIFSGLDESGNLTYDDYRRQQSLAVLSTKAAQKKIGYDCKATFDMIKNDLAGFLSPKYSKYKLSAGVVLESVPGGAVQSWHRDFRMDLGLHSEPMTVFVALSDCQLDFLDSPNSKSFTTASLGLGCVLLFRGYTVHRGCGYDNLNMRMHFYGVQAKDEAMLKKIDKTTKVMTFPEDGEESDDTSGKLFDFYVPK
jgi:hypothetical protein